MWRSFSPPARSRRWATCSDFQANRFLATRHFGSSSRLSPCFTTRYCDPGAAAVSYYRGVFGDDTLDGRIREMVARIPEEEAGELVLMVPEIPRMVFPGVGKRADMVHWGVLADGMDRLAPTREPCTATLTLAYQITGDVSFASRALRQASRKLRLARRVLRGGREHADMGGAVCSVAAGHGRNWGSGAVTGCYGPLLLGARERLGAVKPAVGISPVWR